MYDDSDEDEFTSGRICFPSSLTDDDEDGKVDSSAITLTPSTEFDAVKFSL